MRRGSVGRTGAQPPGGCPPRAAVPRPPRGLTACGAPRPASCPSPSRSCWDSATASGTWRRGWSPAPPAAPIPAGCGDRPRPWGRRAPLPACPGRTEPPRSRPPCPPPSAPSAAPRRAPTTAAGSAPSPDSAPRRGCSRPGSDPGARSRRGWRRGRRSRTAEGGWRGRTSVGDSAAQAGLWLLAQITASNLFVTHRARTRAPAAGPMSVPVARASRAPGVKKSSLSKSTTHPASPCSPLRAPCGGGLAQLSGMPPHERLRHLSHDMHPPGLRAELALLSQPSIQGRHELSGATPPAMASSRLTRCPMGTGMNRAALGQMQLSRSTRWLQGGQT